MSLLCHALLPTSSAAPLQPLSCFQNCSGSQGTFQGTFQGTHRSQGVGVWGWFSGADIPSPMQPQCQDRQPSGSLLSWSPAGTQWTFTLTLVLTRRRGSSCLVCRLHRDQQAASERGSGWQAEDSAAAAGALVRLGWRAPARVWAPCTALHAASRASQMGVAPASSGFLGGTSRREAGPSVAAFPLGNPKHFSDAGSGHVSH